MVIVDGEVQLGHDKLENAYIDDPESLGKEGRYKVLSYRNLETNYISVENTKMSWVNGLDRPLVMCRKRDRPCLCNGIH